MQRLALFILFISFFYSRASIAQDTLPRFSVKNVGNNRIVVGWTNAFDSVRQISIQRSYDSLKGYKSIFTVVDPTIPENGYVDTKAPSDRMFYRLYIQLDKGVYLFSEAHRPVLDTAMKSTARLQKPDNNQVLLPSIPPPDVATGSAPTAGNNRPKPEMWSPSKYVYTLKDGYLKITLPEEEDKKYNIKFFTIEGEPLFELKDVKERSFKVEKTLFYHSGWFKFELYENGELKEKNKFYIPKEF
jgi:hypothetical protein